MTLEYSGRQKPLEEKIKSWISEWTGLPTHEDLRETAEVIAPGNMIATHHPLEKQATWIYESVDKVVSIVKKVGIIKK